MNLKGLYWDHAPKYCGNCRTVRSEKGGLDVQKGADRRVWWCKRCVDISIARKAAEVQLAND